MVPAEASQTLPRPVPVAAGQTRCLPATLRGRGCSMGMGDAATTQRMPDWLEHQGREEGLNVFIRLMCYGILNQEILMWK